jgi:putative nucleotidyltransferase with HDIG domain
VRTPPRLVARTLAVTFVTVAVILSVVFIILTVEVRDRVRAAETEKLQVSERMFTALETRRQQDQLAAVTVLTENPTLKAALQTYVIERKLPGFAADQEQQLRNTVQRQVEDLASATAADVVAIVSAEGRIFTSAGPNRAGWPVGQPVDIPNSDQPAFAGVAVLPGSAFRVTGAALRFGDETIGSLVLGTRLDLAYAQQMAALASTGVVITLDGKVIARTVPEDVTRGLLSAGSDPGMMRTFRGEEYAVRPLLVSDRARIYSLSSIDDAAGQATHDALAALAMIALGALVLAALGSLWLARSLTEPINRVARSIATMTAGRDFGRTLEPTGASRELDALTDAFNQMMRGITAAEAETRSAYLGAIRALAAALDARDAYTAGHSERVSTLSVLIAREMALPDGDIDIVRMGALLHDIGKIGVADEVLRKPGSLTADEFEQIKRHPALGARILRQVPFLAPHLPIVELHHERPDGCGYPFGLRGDDIPLAARIVHVADAFDAMTSARAYRPARDASIAVAELRRYKGTQFDSACVDALLEALPRLRTIGNRTAITVPEFAGGSV